MHNSISSILNRSSIANDTSSVAIAQLPELVELPLANGQGNGMDEPLGTTMTGWLRQGAMIAIELGVERWHQVVEGKGGITTDCPAA